MILKRLLRICKKRKGNTMNREKENKYNKSRMYNRFEMKTEDLLMEKLKNIYYIRLVFL